MLLVLRGSRGFGSRAVTHQAGARVLAELERRFDELLVWLADRPFFFADRPSVADLAIFAQMQGLQSGPTPQAVELIRARPALQTYVARVDAATRGRASASAA